MLNIVVLMGRLTGDPELRTTSSGISYCRFSIAVDRSFARPGGEKKTDFFNCIAWRQTAEFISRYFSKGQMIAVNGSLQTGSYVNKEGVKINTVDIVVDNASFTGSKRESEQSSYTGSTYSAPSRTQQPAPAPAPAPTYSSGSASDFENSPLDDDLPF